MVISFEQASIDVRRQVLAENAEIVVLGIERHPARLTPKRHLRLSQRRIFTCLLVTIPKLPFEGLDGPILSGL